MKCTRVAGREFTDGKSLGRNRVISDVRCKMSFVHLDYVGHFAPHDPIVLSKPFRPKPTRPIDPETINELVRETGAGIERLVYLEGGYLVCEWTRDLRIGVDVWASFIRSLADRTGAVIMNQYGGIDYPEDAKQAYDEWAASQIKQRT